MALVVEDGTGKSTANTYVTLTEFETYHELRGNSEVEDATDDENEQALVRAADYLNTLRWKGEKYSETQALSWPRAYVYDEDGNEVDEESVPAAVKNAQMEAALRELTPGTLIPDLSHGGKIKRRKIEGIETEYFGGAGGTTFPLIKGLLKGLMNSGVSIEIVRG
jgi:hypothetical protein